jgi:hypothetical protein
MTEEQIAAVKKREKEIEDKEKELLWLEHQQSVKSAEFVGPEAIPEVTKWSEFDKVKFPQERWRIEKFIPIEGFVIIASPSGEKKTWLAYDMARSIANGEDFLKNPEFKTEKGAVLYIDQEMAKSEIQNRGRVLSLPSTSEPIFLLSRNSFDLSQEKNVEWLFSFIAENNIKAVFVDTLRAVAGGLNEDKAEEVRAFFDKFKPLKDKGVVVIFLDHCRKPSHFEGRLPKKEQLFGSQDKLASIETLIMIKSEERSEEIFIYPKKSRSGIEYEPFRVEMKPVEVNEKMEAVKIELTYAGKEEEREYKIDKAKTAVMDLLMDSGKTRKEILNFLLEKYKIGGKNASEALRELEKDAKISSTKTGRENFYQILKEEIAYEDNLFED